MLAVETRGLSRRYGKLLAVDDMNLQVPAGALFGLIGPNGAGKTTTLRMLAGLLEPTSGDIVIGGHVANHDWRLLRRQIGYMPDFFGVYEDMLVWEYLDFFGRCYDLPAARRGQVIDELLELVDLTGKREAYVQTLSRGMRQRLCLAHALVTVSYTHLRAHETVLDLVCRPLLEKKKPRPLYPPCSPSPL